MVLAAAAAACASTHGCPLASDDGFLTAEDTSTRSSSHEFRRDETNPTSPARHSTTKFLSLPIGVEVTPTFDYNSWRYDQRSITFRDSYSTPKPTASLWNSTIFIIFGQPFLDYFDDNLSGFEAWAWASCPDTGTYYKFVMATPIPPPNLPYLIRILRQMARASPIGPTRAARTRVDSHGMHTRDHGIGIPTTLEPLLHVHDSSLPSIGA